MIDKFVKNLVTNLRILNNERADLLSKGTAKSYDEYREGCGTILGLDIAINEIQFAYRKLLQGDNDGDGNQAE